MALASHTAVGTASFSYSFTILWALQQCYPMPFLYLFTLNEYTGLGALRLLTRGYVTVLSSRACRTAAYNESSASALDLLPLSSQEITSGRALMCCTT